MQRYSRSTLGCFLELCNLLAMANPAHAGAGVPFFIGCIAWNFSPALMGAAAPAVLRVLVSCGALLQVQSVSTSDLMSGVSASHAVTALQTVIASTRLRSPWKQR